MKVEAIGDRNFIHSVQEYDGVWVLFSGQTAYMLQVEGGRALPVWVSSQSAEKFSGNLKQSGLSSVFVPLESLLGQGWFGSPALEIVEVLASPKHGQQALTYTVIELSEKLKT
jgi:hypothetical protein